VPLLAQSTIDFGRPVAQTAGHGCVGASRHPLKVLFPLGPHEIPKPKLYNLCLARFTHNPLERSHLLHLNPTITLLHASPCLLLFSRALFIVSCKSYHLTLQIYS
jgi:hypothetical protein